MTSGPHAERLAASTTSASAQRGVNPVVYWSLRAILQPVDPASTSGCAAAAASTSREGAVILAANHRSFLDPFVIGCCLRRPIYFVAKRELFDNRLLGWFLNCLGAFPVRRGESDEEAMTTALDAARARRGRGDLPRGHAQPHGPLARAQARRRPAGARRAARPWCRSR